MSRRKRPPVRPETPSATPATSSGAQSSRRAWLAFALVALAVAAGAWWFSTRAPAPILSSRAPVDSAEAATYVGSRECADCHADAWKAWQGSQHAAAMQPATQATVLGDFNAATFTANGVESRFFRRDGGFFVHTDGPDGVLADFEISDTFGVYPLQQYLVALPGGRLQALSIAWDSRPRAQGGQRWFHLYPNEKITHDDVLHWTRPAQNWNSQCADCHSTHLVKHYDALSRTFATTWSEINVACEACHGPGSRHLAWAKQAPDVRKKQADQGLVVGLDERRGVSWSRDPLSGKPARGRPRSTEREIEVCAHCHSRRSPIADGYTPGQPLLDFYLPELLRAGLYYPDGQIEDEVYVYGSFLQSRMYAAGVTCSDCHDPHSMRLRVSGNGVCTQCHAPETYDRPTHHHHTPDAAGAACVDCHMPTRTYMVVDPRRDHSLRIPRPDLSARLGTPNACNQCHTDKNAEWAAARIKDWFGAAPSGFQTYADALDAARKGTPDAGRALAALLRDAQVPAIARATALAELGPYLDVSTLDVLSLALDDASPLVRTAGVGVLEPMPPDLRVRLAFPMLEDPVRAVRIEAARVLAAVPAGELSPARRSLLENATREYRAGQLINAERPEAQVNLGSLDAAQGNIDAAVEAFKTAQVIDPWFVPAYANLADLHRAQGQDALAEQVLRQGIEAVPDAATLHHALGLTLVREHRADAALDELKQAADLDPEQVRYRYVYGVALHSSGRVAEAIATLEQALTRFPDNPDLLTALTAYYRDKGDTAAAERYAQRLQALSGHPPQ